MAQQIEIPDENFEQQLIDLKIDTDGVLNKRISKKDVKHLKKLDLSIKEFSVNKKKIQDLKGIEAFTNLEILDVSWHAIQRFDASSNKNLVEFIAVGNKLSSVAVTKNKSLRTLNLRENRLEEIDVSENKNLETLHLGTNKLENIYLEKNKDLHTLFLQENNLKELDVFANKKLHQLNIEENPDLACINIDEEVSIKKVTKNTYQTLTKYCNFTIAQEAQKEVVIVPDVNFEIALQSFGYDRDYKINGQIHAEDALKVDILGLNDKNIKDLSGIEAFENLRFLAIYNNQISSINLKNNTKLETLWASNNLLETVDLSKNTQLKHLVIDHNKLKQLNLNTTVNLEVLEVQYNLLNHLDISKLGKLTKFLAQENPLMSLTDDDAYEAIRGNYTKQFLIKPNTFPPRKQEAIAPQTDVQKSVEDTNINSMDDLLVDEPAYVSNCSEVTEKVAKKNCTNNVLQKIIADNFNYDLARALKYNENGYRITLLFEIDKNGFLINPRASSVHKELIDETMRMITFFPTFIPAKKNGVNKKSFYALPVIVKLVD